MVLLSLRDRDTVEDSFIVHRARELKEKQIFALFFFLGTYKKFFLACDILVFTLLNVETGTTWYLANSDDINSLFTGGNLNMMYIYDITTVFENGLNKFP